MTAVQNTFPQNHATSSAIPDSDGDADHAVPQHHVVYFGTSVCDVRQSALHGKLLTGRSLFTVCGRL